MGRQFDELITQLPGAIQQVTSYLEQTEWGRWVLGRAAKAGHWFAQPEVMARDRGRAVAMRLKPAVCGAKRSWERNLRGPTTPHMAQLNVVSRDLEGVDCGA